MKPKVNCLPLLPLKDAVILPQSIAPIFIGRASSIQAIEESLKTTKDIIIVTQKDEFVESPSINDLYPVGTRATILQVMRMPKGSLKILVEGLSRIQVTSVDISETDCFYARYQEVEENKDYKAIEIHALWRNFIALYKTYSALHPKTPVPAELLSASRSLSHISSSIDSLALHCNLNIVERQTVLELANLKERIMYLCTYLQKEIDIAETEKRISHQVQHQIEKNQREYYLNEQIKAIHKELGRDENADLSTLYEKKNALKLPQEADEKILVELKKLEQIPPFSPEASVSRNYIDWIFALPWNTTSKDRISLSQAEKILDQKHAGLQKAKERILEFIATKKFNPTLTAAPVICLVGPPGVGKTSIARSIADALGREFIRISLGGVRDEAEIRGHRRTYIGAQPGKFIQAFRKAKTTNPVILLDEIDKMALDYHGDPASALLEVLDPEQHRTFQDNYLEIGYDLSQVMFIATANHPDGIPFPLLDRMEMINLPGYTEAEKLEIAQKFLIPKNLKEHGLSPEQCRFTPAVIKNIIASYSKEAGVRQLERLIAKLIRKSIQYLLEHKKETKIALTTKHCVKWLGPAQFKRKNFETEHTEIGCATGLAWTELGGDILEIETTTIPGKGELTLTGQLGEVMQESAHAALSYIRSRAEQFGIKKTFFSTHDIHIHVPEGATPKDGPSAGITICTALISTLTDIPIKPAVAMTGEITLRGRVLPVGGLKEKILAAQQHGIKTIMLPHENKEEVLKISEDFIKEHDLKLHFVQNMDEVIAETLKKSPFKTSKIIK